MDKNNDGFVSYDEFIGATKEPEYEKPPEEKWEPIDDEKEFTDEEFEEYEKQFGDYDEEVSLLLREGRWAYTLSYIYCDCLKGRNCIAQILTFMG